MKVLDKYKAKPVLDKYKLIWYPVLKQAERACARENKRVGEGSEGCVYIWPREYKSERKRDFIVEQRRIF